jgi:hypothetical protein
MIFIITLIYKQENCQLGGFAVLVAMSLFSGLIPSSRVTVTKSQGWALALQLLVLDLV